MTKQYLLNYLLSFPFNSHQQLSLFLPDTDHFNSSLPKLRAHISWFLIILQSTFKHLTSFIKMYAFVSLNDLKKKKKLVFLLIWPPVCYYTEFSVGLNKNISTVGWPNGQWLHNSCSLIGAEDEYVEKVATCFADLNKMKQNNNKI